MPATSVSFEDVTQARRRLEGIAKRTPVLTSSSFNERAGVQAFLKCENFQTGGAFKIRGAANFVFSIPEQDRARGVVAFSSGNHAQGVAIAARRAGIAATIVMPLDAPKTKVAGTRAQGATIVTYDRFKEDRAAIGARIAKETGATLVPPFDHPWIVAGQGTAACELLEDAPDLDAIVVPIGGGGLIAGSSIAARNLRLGIRVVGVEPELANDAYLSLEAGKRIEISPPETIADGLRVPMVGELPFAIIQKNVDHIVLVTEDEIRAATLFLLMRLKILVEPSGAASAAAVLFGKIPAGSGRVGVILSGGNVDFDVLASLDSSGQALV